MKLNQVPRKMVINLETKKYMNNEMKWDIIMSLLYFYIIYYGVDELIAPADKWVVG